MPCFCDPSVRGTVSEWQYYLKIWLLCSSEVTVSITNGDKTWNNLLSRNMGTWVVDWHQSFRLISGHLLDCDTNLYQQPTTFLNATARCPCSNQSNNRSGIMWRAENPCLSQPSSSSRYTGVYLEQGTLPCETVREMSFFFFFNTVAYHWILVFKRSIFFTHQQWMK